MGKKLYLEINYILKYMAVELYNKKYIIKYLKELPKLTLDEINECSDNDKMYLYCYFHYNDEFISNNYDDIVLRYYINPYNPTINIYIIAILCGNIEIIKYLEQRNYFKNNNLSMWFIFYIIFEHLNFNNNHMEILKDLYEKKNFNMNKYNDILFYSISKNKDLSLIKYLIKNDININHNYHKLMCNAWANKNTKLKNYLSMKGPNYKNIYII